MSRSAIAARLILVSAMITAGVAAAFAWRQPIVPRRPLAHVSRPVPQPRPSAKPIATTTAAPATLPTPAPLIVKRVLDMGGPIAFGEFKWDEAGVPRGPLIITVDLAAQTLSVFRDGYEIGATAILYGADAKPTPLGTFPITQKDAHHFSRTYGGAPMPYSLRLTTDGVFIHGSKVEWGYATHGCVGVPVDFARKLFGVASVGDRVIITRGKFIGLGQPIAS